MRIGAGFGAVAGRRCAFVNAAGPVGPDVRRAQMSAVRVDALARLEDKILARRNDARVFAIGYHDP